MSRTIESAGTNGVSIVGKVNDIVMRDGTSKVSGKPYRSGIVTIRVEQHYGANGGKDEVSEIPVNFIAMKFKKDGTSNPIYESLGELKNYKSIQNYGYDEATRVRVVPKGGRLQENMFVGRDAEQVVSSWQVSSSFFNVVRGSADANTDCATFNVDLFIMSMSNETTPDGELTGRLKIRAGIVQYGRKLDCFDFYVENPSTVDYIERNWNVNDTVNAVGRIRYTSEVVTYHSENSWGEDIPHSSTKMKRELIITSGSDIPFDEDSAYAPEDIQVLNADRNNRKEQLKIDARSRANTKKAAATVSADVGSNYGWEE